MQQHLPFTVLKPTRVAASSCNSYVATTPTVYGIETANSPTYVLSFCAVATTPTVYGIETLWSSNTHLSPLYVVATTPTVYGIETFWIHFHYRYYEQQSCNNTYRLRY